MIKYGIGLLAILLLTSAFATFSFYPIDGYERTGIKRLKRLEQVKNGEVKESTSIPSGALKSYMDIELNLVSEKNG
ncbi:hypothetical protein [Maribacter litopenaei]|uniref:hypothetical protein n=1 Tax=Maribacter litopenaei TaxID=2976127 RepID=UPI003084323C